jgi:hypothetical protein
VTTTLTAVPVIYTNPTFDAVIFGAPTYFWIIVLLAFITIIMNIIWFRRRSIMFPVLGYLTSLKNGQPVTLYLGKNKSFSVKSLEYIDSILSYKDVTLVPKWLMQSPKSAGRLGGLSALIVRDNFDYTVDPVAEIAICTLAKNWNEKYSETKPMNCYNDFVKYRNDGNLENEYPDGIEIPVYNIYDPSLIQKYLPVGRSAGIFGSNLIARANELRKDRTQESKWAKYMPILVIITISVIMLVFAYMYGTGGI